MEFTYSYVFDLVYHVLAHMQVNNPSNLYSEEYIAMINEAKGGQFEDITVPLSQLAEYYNANFERLCTVNFLPFGCQNLDALTYMVEQQPYFTAEDKVHFLTPFLQLLQKEALFYEAYWKGMYDRSEQAREHLATYLAKKWKKYKVLGSYFHKNRVLAGISYSMTCNGRGLYASDVFAAVVPFTEEEREYISTFLQLLHEYTHTFTDPMLQQDISMEDGSHNFSEYVVMVFDYYLIKALCPEDLEDYLCYMSRCITGEEEPISEELLFSVLTLRTQWHEKLQQLVKDICSFQE